MPTEKTDGKVDNRRFIDGFRILQGELEYLTYKEHSSIRVWTSAIEDSFDRHYHSAIEIMMCTRGEVTYTLPQKSYHVAEGEVLFVPPETPHALSMRAGSERYLFLFEPDLLKQLRDFHIIQPFMNQPLYLNEDTELRQNVIRLLKEIYDTYTKEEPLWNTLCYSYILQLLAVAGRNCLLNEVLPDDTMKCMDTEFLDSAIIYVNQHYSEDISLISVSDFVGFSRHYFSRKFKQYVGMSFTEYLCNCRISAAVERLIHTSEPIGQVASHCGFSSIVTFNRVFKNLKNCTPSKYRALYGEVDPVNAESSI